MATYTDFAPFVENAYNNSIGVIIGAINRRLNYKYNEMAAENADRRTRALYNDIYSPKALLNQYAEAGLSPSLMFGGTPGQGGTSGAQGGGAAGQPMTYTPINLMESAQIENIKADTELKNAEADKAAAEAANTELLKDINNWIYQEKSLQTIMTINPILLDEDGEKWTSLYEIAKKSNSYDNFVNNVHEAVKQGPNGDWIRHIDSEMGRKIMQEVYQSIPQLEHDITILNNETVSSNFQKSIVKALQAHNYEEMNAQAAITQFESEIATNELNAEQKNAWNHVIGYIRDKAGDKWADALLIISMLISQFAGKVHPTINTGDRTFNISNNNK